MLYISPISPFRSFRVLLSLWSTACVPTTAVMGAGLLKYNIFGRGFKLQVAITVTCQIAFIFFGYDQGVFSGIVRVPISSQTPRRTL